MFAIGIVWIGFSLRPEMFDEHKKILDLMKLTKPADASDGSKYLQQYVLTQLGEAINLTEYVTRMVNASESTYALHMEDWINEMVPLVQRNIFVSGDSGFDDLVLS